MSRISSLRAASRHSGKLLSLNLEKSQDLVCLNIMCSRLTQACACKLARWTEQSKNKLQELEELNLSYNRLEVIPPAIFQLSSITHLDLRGNWLTVVPPEITKLTRLKVLHLQENKLHSLPSELFTHCKDLTEVLVDMNPDYVMHEEHVKWLKLKTRTK